MTEEFYNELQSLLKKYDVVIYAHVANQVAPVVAFRQGTKVDKFLFVTKYEKIAVSYTHLTLPTKRIV